VNDPFGPRDSGLDAYRPLSGPSEPTTGHEGASSGVPRTARGSADGGRGVEPDPDLIYREGLPPIHRGFLTEYDLPDQPVGG
jgi:hypothetical protein